MPGRPWEDISQFPDSPLDWCVFFPLINRLLSGQPAVTKQLKHPNILYPALISTPTSGGKFLPPPVLTGPEVSDCVERIKSDKRKIARILLFYLVLLPIVAFWLIDFQFAFSWFLINLILYVYCELEYRKIVNDDEALKEKAMFFAWLFCNGRPYLYVTVAFFLAVGIVQYALGLYYGTNDEVLERFGLLYVAVSSDHEWWRFFTGPLLHSGAAHWLGNLLIGCGFAILCGPLMQKQFYWLALASAVVSFLADYYAKVTFGLDGDGIIGMSGGIAGPIGWLIAMTVRQSAFFPERFVVTAVFAAFITLIAASIMMAGISLVCHTTGLLFGIMVATTQRLRVAPEVESG